MTHQEIMDFAVACAEAAFDAHGPDHMPQPVTAYDFLRQLKTDAYADRIWDRLWIEACDWPLFCAAYKHHFDALVRAQITTLIELTAWPACGRIEIAA